MAQDQTPDNDKQSAPAVADSDASSAAAQTQATPPLPDKKANKKAAKKAAKESDPTKKPRGSALALFCFLLMVLLAAAGGWFGWQMWQQLQQLEREPASAATPVTERFDPSAIHSDLSALNNRLRQQQEQLQQLQDKPRDNATVNRLGTQLAAMERRLQAISDTSRDDWKLAEAAFLLRLASQRMLLEHNSAEAIALAQTADTILRDQQDPDLFGVRQTLARELAELKMLQPIDREGLYTRLQALTEQVDKLNQLQSYQREAIGPTTDATAAAQPQGVWQKVKASVNRAFSTLGSYIRVRDREQKVTPMLAPEQRYFLTQNLRLMLEQAQLGLLREQSQVYQVSLQKAQRWIEQYFEHDKRANVMLDELAQLQQEPISIELPDIHQALGQLQAYIQKLHQIEAGGTP